MGTKSRSKKRLRGGRRIKINVQILEAYNAFRAGMIGRDWAPWHSVEQISPKNKRFKRATRANRETLRQAANPEWNTI